MRESDVDRRDLRVETGGSFARALTMVGLNATAMLHDATAAIRTAWQGLQVKKLLRGIYQPSRGFGDLAGYTSVIKHRKVAERFNFTDPFYRCHEESLGSKIFIDGREYLNFSSYDYIGLNRHPVVSQAAKAAIDQYGTSVSASRIVSGERVFHRELESALADLYEAQAALCFVSGHATNVSTIAALMESADLVVHDELAHNSILVGAKLSGATVRPFRHNDMAALEKLLDEERGCYKNALIVVEGLYSMDGDIPDLPRLIELKQRHNAWLMVDEAHALGVLGKHGRGVHEHFDIDPSDVDIWMGTLSKALSACGGYIAGSHELIEILKFRAARPGLFGRHVAPGGRSGVGGAAAAQGGARARRPPAGKRRPLPGGSPRARPRYRDQPGLRHRAHHGGRHRPGGPHYRSDAGARGECAADHLSGSTPQGSAAALLCDKRAHPRADPHRSAHRGRRAAQTGLIRSLASPKFARNCP